MYATDFAGSVRTPAKEPFYFFSPHMSRHQEILTSFHSASERIDRAGPGLLNEFFYDVICPDHGNQANKHLF